MTEPDETGTAPTPPVGTPDSGPLQPILATDPSDVPSEPGSPPGAPLPPASLAAWWDLSPAARRTLGRWSNHDAARLATTACQLLTRERLRPDAVAHLERIAGLALAKLFAAEAERMGADNYAPPRWGGHV